jgi:folate-dependent phosphoribosylglycinamide formyltransferase PurN
MAGTEKSDSKLTIAILTRQGESLAYFLAEDFSTHKLGKIVIIAQKQRRNLLSMGLRFLRENGFIPLLKFINRRRQSKMALAAAMTIPYLLVDNLNSRETENLLKANNVDLGVLANTGIIKKEIIKSCRLGIIMAHTGILPEYRGINCNGWALLNDDDMGVSTLLIDEGIDTGPILLKEALDKNSICNRNELSDQLLSLRITLVRKSIQGLRDGSIIPLEQKADEGKLYTLKMLTPEIKQKIDEKLKIMFRNNLAQRA